MFAPERVQTETFRASLITCDMGQIPVSVISNPLIKVIALTFG